MAKKKNNIMRVIIILLLIAFIVLYLSSSFGYFEYANHQRTILTEEAIEKFEGDIKSNERLDTKSYLEGIKMNYQNDLTNACSGVSSGFNKYFKLGIERVFGIINKLVGE